MKSLFLFPVCCLLVACQPAVKHADDLSVQDSLHTLKEQAALRKHLDSAGIAFAKSIHEPNIRTYRHETYRYWLSLFLQEDFIFRLEDSAGHWLLTSKRVADECEDCDSGHVVQVNGKTRRVAFGSVIDSTVQELSPKEWENFSNLLEGSYYRQLQQSYVSCVLDGDGLALEALSPVPCSDNDSLGNYTIGIHIPRKGSFRDACAYLSSISLLTRGHYKLLWR